ncbi:myocardin isoform X2 [Engraulis encrasicolus]|uniref:myocardin isoform X2 n=1 Tax=Engraulis encrasicolus TaxID=184585 RepID=UPI002FD6388A
MTLLASERSILIRNKFRSVLQLRIQNRRQQSENNADPGLKNSCPPKPGEKDTSDALRQTDDGATQKSPPSGLTAETAKDGGGVGGAHRQKRPRMSDDLSERIQLRPCGPQDLLNKNILPLNSTSVSFPVASDVFEDDISCSCSSSSSSPEQLGMLQSPSAPSAAFSLSSPPPGLSSDQSLSDLSPANTPLNRSPNQRSLALLPATESIKQPMTMTVAETNSMATAGRSKGMCMTSQTASLLQKTAQQQHQQHHQQQPIPQQPQPPHSMLAAASAAPSSRPPRSRKPRDWPKMRELKYHQYIPPDQRGTAGNGSSSSSSSSAQKSSGPAQTIDPAYSRLLQQQQVFLQLQILNQQQQQVTVATSGDKQLVRVSGSALQSQASVSPSATPAVPAATSVSQKPEPLPLNLDDLKVSELRQHLRKRGLTVSGTKPALLERLRPFHLPRPCVATPTTATAPVPAPVAPLPQLGCTQDACSSGSLSNTTASPTPASEPPVAAAKPGHVFIQQAPGAVVASCLPDQGMSSVGFLASSSSPPMGSSPGLQASSPLSSGAPWRSEQAAEELSVELKMRERIRNRPRDRQREVSISESCAASLHPFLQQDPGCTRGKEAQDGQAEVLFPQVFTSQMCDVIGQDFELPQQITASPVASHSPGVRSLEEELQEAIQRVQMDPSQSIDDILEGTIGHSDEACSVTEIQSPDNFLAGPSPPAQSDQSQAPQSQSKDENFLSSPLCSSLLLELPPSPSTTLPVTPAPPPPPPPTLCTTPPPNTGRSRKRRKAATLDTADWLESLTSGLRPLTPPAAPFVEEDFGLDWDLNVNRVLDLMVEQW